MRLHLCLRQGLLLLLLVVPGVFCFLFCMYYALQDWAVLPAAYANFLQIAGTSSDISELFAAEAQQNVHRFNLFAEVVWALMGAIVAVIGIHGLCVNWQKQK